MRYKCEYNEDTYQECTWEVRTMLKQVDRIGLQNHLQWKYFPGSGYLFVYSKIGTWKVKLQTDVFVMYHQNTSGKMHGSYSECFHRQENRFTDLMEAIRYIAAHDNRKFQRDQRRIYNSSIERAFRQIERQRRVQQGNYY